MRAFSARHPLVGVSTIAGLVSLIVLLIVPAAVAGKQEPLPHCVSQVVNILADGEMILGPEVCFPTLEEALAYGDANFASPKLPAARIGKSAKFSARGTQAAGPGESTQGSSRLATHFDGYNGSGPSRSFYGSCSGGYINLAGYGWANRISSTANGCRRVKHHNGQNASGSYCSTYGSGASNVCSSLNNKADSTSYHP